MKISVQIFLLAAILLGFLGGYAFLSSKELAKFHREFDGIVQNDLTLMQSATTLNEIQLRKEILFEKLISSSEELAFGNANESRKQYLLDYIADLQQQFKDSGLKSREQIKQVWGLGPMLTDAQKTLNLYDQKVANIFAAVLSGGYQLSLEDLDQVETQQASLAKSFQKIMQQVWAKVNHSVDEVKLLQKRGQRLLWTSMAVSFIFALIVSWAIIHRINHSLNLLVKGVRLLQQGQLGTQVTIASADEIAEFAKAFNQMSQQLKDYQDQMQGKNADLARGLELTLRQKKELETTNRDLDRFVHLIGHDIAGPLSGMIGYSSYLHQHKDAFEPKAQQVIEHLHQSSQRLHAMVKDLLEMTKITRTRRPFEKVDVGILIQEVIERQQFMIQKNSATIHLPEHFPVIVGDPLKLTVVFYNLIGNAIKYSSFADHKPQVTIGWEKNPSGHVFFVKDNGIGIDPISHKEIFDMFKRLPEAEIFEGSGVGLAIVKEIIHEHVGRVWVESIRGQGAKFFFTIPLESPSHFS